MSIAIILAAGLSTRWFNNYANPYERHFVPIWGEPLIERLLRQLNENKTQYLLLGNTPRLLAFECAEEPTPTRTKAECIANYSHAFHSRTHILLGDVLYPDDRLKTILADESLMAFYGDCTGNELFAMTFSDVYRDNLLKHLRHAATSSGNLWEIYRSVIGVPLDRHLRDSEVLKPFLDDRLIRDFDHFKDYEDFTRQFPQPP